MKDKIIIGIYKITSPSGKIYIGQSVNINVRWYKDYNNRLHRFNFNKGALKSKGYDINKTESVIMNEIGYKTIWDCGVTRFEWCP